MRLKKYCVTVMDNWTPVRFFWSRWGACRHFLRFCAGAHLFVWRGNAWDEVLPPDLEPGRIEKLWLDYRTHRDLTGGSRFPAVMFALSNPRFPKWRPR